MTRCFPPSDREATSAAIPIDATRRWRQARDRGYSAQPCLAQALDEHGCAMLAPVFDSLIRLYENALGRPIVVGASEAPSEDELFLLELLKGSRACADCPRNAKHLLDCALCSTRIMMSLTLRPGSVC